MLKMLSVLLLLPSLAWSETTILTSCGDDVFYLHWDGKNNYGITPDMLHYPSGSNADKTWLEVLRDDIEKGQAQTLAVDVYSPETVCGTIF